MAQLRLALRDEQKVIPGLSEIINLAGEIFLPEEFARILKLTMNKLNRIFFRIHRLPVEILIEGAQIKSTI